MPDIRDIVFDPNAPIRLRHHTCGHVLPEIEAVCGNCKLHACDECADDWKVCISCSGGICSKCEVSAQKRRDGVSGRKEYICYPCWARFRRARETLIINIKSVVYELEKGIWVDAVIYDIESAVAYAKEKADL